MTLRSFEVVSMGIEVRKLTFQTPDVGYTLCNCRFAVINEMFDWAYECGVGRSQNRGKEPMFIVLTLTNVAISVYHLHIVIACCKRSRRIA